MKIGNSSVDFKGLLIDGPAGCQSMEPKIMKLLRVLADNAGQVMTREDIITAVWGVEYGGDERLSRGISILRKALGDKRGQHTHIVTISRVGYRLIAAVDKNEIAQAKPFPNEVPQNSGRFVIASPATAEVLAPLSTADNAFKARPLPAKGIAAVASLIMACVIIGFFVFSGGHSGETLSRQANMERGFSHIENFTPKGAISEAQDIFGKILSDDPSHAGARAGLAFAIFREYTHLERDPALLQRAKAHAEAALRADEHLALANIAVAWAAEFEGDFDRAHEYLDRADILDPGNMFALEGSYRVYGRQGQIEKAGEILNTAIETYPNKALFYRYRGSYFNRTGRFLAAENDLRKALDISPDSPRTYAQLAHSLHSQGRTGEAVGTIQQGLKINETALLYNNLGTYLFFQGQYGLAASAFEKTLALSGDTHDYLYWANLGDAYRWSQDKGDEAASSYRRALQLLQVELDRYPDDNNLKSRAALFNAKLGNLDQAQLYMNSFDLTPTAPSVQLYRSVVTYEILSNRTKALKNLEAAIKSSYPMIEILNDPNWRFCDKTQIITSCSRKPKIIKEGQLTQYTLKLSFDLRQVTQSLAYEFVLGNNATYPMEGGGPLAGTFNFQQGDEIFVEVMATSAAHPDGPGKGPKDILKDFTVTNCTFVSIPAHMTELLSLFDATSACSTVDEWGPIENATTPEDKQKNTLRLYTRSLKALPVVTKNGQWQISGYLSTQLTSMSGDKRAQLYFFDPESSTGTGGGWNP